MMTAAAFCSVAPPRETQTRIQTAQPRRLWHQPAGRMESQIPAAAPALKEVCLTPPAGAAGVSHEVFGHWTMETPDLRSLPSGGQQGGLTLK